MKIEIRRRSWLEGAVYYKCDTDVTVVGRSWSDKYHKTLFSRTTLYVVVVNGRRVESFLSYCNARRCAAQLRTQRAS